MNFNTIGYYIDIEITIKLKLNKLIVNQYSGGYDCNAKSNI